MNSLEELIQYFKKNKIEYHENESLSLHTTFKLGGKASVYVCPSTEEELGNIISKCNELQISRYLIGNGSNVLFSDKGFEGCVISTSESFNKIRLIDETTIECDSGVKLSSLCKFALEHSLTGFECFYGIPGTVGGAIITNAGAYGGEISDVVVEVNHIDDTLQFGSLIGEEIDFSYRHSAYETNNFTICSVVFVSEKGNYDLIKEKMDELLKRRVEKQPLDYPSAGSTFKRPIGGYAAALIDEAGLKGLSVGGAMVSKKHSGFLINYDNSTSEDMLKLIDLVKAKVYENCGINLECEVRVIK